MQKQIVRDYVRILRIGVHDNRMKQYRTKSYGFTLVELLIVMVILSILAVIVTGTFSSSSRRGRDARRKNDLKSIASALEAYYNDKGVYPTGVGGVMKGCDTGDAQSCNWGGQFKDSKGTLYMVLIPIDPFASQTYYYYSTNGRSYQIFAHLENTLDAGDGVNQSGYTTPTGNKCGIGTALACTYGTASTDTTIQ